MAGLSDFGTFATQLANPLVLVGFVLLLFFTIHKSLIKSGIIPPVKPGEAPAIVRAILHYGFLIAIVTIILGFLYAGLGSYVDKVVEKHVDLSVIDLVAEKDATFDLKLKNSGTDSAFISEVRFVFFKAVAGNTSCMPVPFEYYEYPFEINAFGGTIQAQKGSEIKDEFNLVKKYIEERKVNPGIDEILQTEGSRERGQFRVPYWITPPLKVSQKVPAGDVDRFKIHFDRRKDIMAPMLPVCNWAVQFKTFAVIIYDGGKFVETPTIYLTYESEDSSSAILNVLRTFVEENKT